MNIWNKMNDEQRRDIKEQFNNIKKEIKHISTVKGNLNGKDPNSSQIQIYDEQIKKLQDNYNDIQINYECSQCGNIFEVSLSNLKLLIKEPDKKLFCCKSCSGIYYANKQRKEETPEAKRLKIEKISNTLKNRNAELTEYEKSEKYGTGLKQYWSQYTAEERSSINKRNAIVCRQTKLNKYGNENYNNIKQIKLTNINKYGVDNQFKLEENRNKAKKIIREKYGVDNFFENREKFKEVSLQRYGVEHPMQNKHIKEKLGNTKFLRYGDMNYNNPTKFNETFLKRYGVKRPFKLKRYVQKSEQTKLKRYGDPHYNNKEKALKTIHERYGENYYAKQLSNIGNRISKVNLKFGEYMNITDFEFPINTYSYDLKKGTTLIEINPTFTHNSYTEKVYGRFGGLQFDYHYNKTKTARDNGYKCINVFDWDDWEKIKYLLQDKETLYARDLELKEVPDKECNEFLIKYHLQDTCKGQIIKLGLYEKDILTEIMTFGKPRYNKNYEWELLRLCTKGDYKVVGGAEKLFKHFVQQYNPNSIISYCDYSKFTGEVYVRLGFKQKGKPSPSLHWSKDVIQITDNLLRQRGFDQLFKTNYGKGTSNEKLMVQHGWLPIYDCGQSTYIWNNK